jgi:peptidoglycan hydrolase-like protein with peptidoglycan-binding domain
MLRQGDSGAGVARWQAIVNEWLLGGYPGTRRLVEREGLLSIDGVFGPATAKATRRFQRTALRIRASGVVDKRTRIAWVAANVTCCGAGYRTVHPGDVSAYVGWWQIALDHWLAERGRHELVIDGVFGTRTAAATLAFRRFAGLPATATAGPRAWKAMAKRNLLDVR